MMITLVAEVFLDFSPHERAARSREAADTSREAGCLISYGKKSIKIRGSLGCLISCGKESRKTLGPGYMTILFFSKHVEYILVTYRVQPLGNLSKPRRQRQ